MTRRRTDFPSMQGWVTLRVVSENQPSPEFQEVYLSLKDGFVRWFEDEDQLVSRGIGLVASKVLVETSSSSIEKTAKSRQISFQILLQHGVQVVELRSKACKYWQSLIDLHFVQCPKSPELLPLLALPVDVSPSAVRSLHVNSTVEVMLLGRTYAVSISLTDDPQDALADLLANVLSNQKLPPEVLLPALITLYQHQYQMFLAAARQFDVLDRVYQREKVEHESLMRRAEAAEQHVAVVTAHLHEIESMIPTLTARLENSDSATLERQKRQEEEPMMSLTIVKSTSRPTTPSRLDSRTVASSSTIPNWRQQYEDAQRELEASKQEALQAKDDLQRLKRDSTSLQRMETLTHENKQLREYSLTLREEILELREQMKQLQAAALDTVNVMAQHSLPQLSVDVDNDPSIVLPFHQQSRGEVDIDLTSFSFHHHQQQSSQRALQLQDFLSPSSEEGGNAHFFDFPDENESQKGDVPASGSDSDVLCNAVLRFPLVKQRLLQRIYDHYCGVTQSPNAPMTSSSPVRTNSNQSFMTMTRFLRFAKEFAFVSTAHVSTSNALVSVHSPVASANPVSTPFALGYGEASMIFTNASKRDTDDYYAATLQRRKTEIFKVRSAPTAGIVNSLATDNQNAVLTRDQFSFAMELLADRLFNVSNAIMHNPVDSEGQSLSVIDMLFVHVLIPASIALDLVPWPLVYLQQILTDLECEDAGPSRHPSRQNPSVYRAMLDGVDLLTTVFANACLDHIKSPHSKKASVVSDALRQCGRDPTRKFVMLLSMEFDVLAKLCRRLALVPFLLGEHQLFNIFKELVSWSTVSRSDAELFPCVCLPPTLCTALRVPCDRFFHEKMQQSSLMLHILHSNNSRKVDNDEVDKKKKIAGSRGIVGLDLEKFILLIGIIALQVYPSVPSPGRKVETILHQISKTYS